MRSVDLNNSEWITASSIIKNPAYQNIFSDRHQVHYLANRGHFRFKKVGRAKFYSREDVSRYVQLVEEPEKEYLCVTQITQDPVYQNVLSRFKIESLAEQGHIRFKEFGEKKFYSNEDIRRYFQLVEELEKNYLSIDQIHETFGCTRARTNIIISEKLKKICIKDGIKFKELDSPILFRGRREELLFLYKPDYLNFRELYITRQEVFNMFDVISPTRLDYLVSYCKVIRKVVIWPKNPLYSKEDLEKAVLSSPVDLNPKEYYTTEEVCAILNFRWDSWIWIKYREANVIPCFRKSLSGKLYYYKKQIDELRAKQNEYTTNYYSPSQAEREVGDLQRLYYYGIKITEAGPLVKMAFGEPRMKGVYLKQEIVQFKVRWSTRKEKEEQLSQIDYKGSLYDAFERYMQVEGMSYEANSATTTKWFEYCQEKLLKTEKTPSIKTRMNKVRAFSDCTDILFKFLQDEELFAFSSNEINLGVLSIKNKEKRRLFYTFCTELYDSLTRIGVNISFNLKRLKNPYNETPENKREKEIYQFDEYQAILNYATDLIRHKNKAIEDSLYKVASKRTTHYASSWLYVLTTLNNAWRHPDIIYNLTALKLERLNIRSIEDLRDRDLTSQEAESVIRQIKAKDKSHTKTNAVARFFSSSVVAIPLATAAIICTLISRELNLGDEIVNFGNTYNDFSAYASNAFFAEFEGEFEFKIQKMNRSLLTFIHQLLVDKGYGGAALELAQRLRSHFDYESTNIYIQIPQGKLDELTEQLFNRQHFGYIHHTFLDVLYGPAASRSSRTKDIATLNSVFSVYEIEATAGFMMKVQHEKQTVMEKIMRMDLHEVKEYLFKISANLLPSKEGHVQCLVSETECLHLETRTCHSCSYAIPNFYAISAITKSITDLLQNFGNTFKSTGGKAYDKTQKTKLSNILLKEIDLLREACDTFGEEEVLSFFEGGEQGYNVLLESLNQVAAADVESHRTYRIGGKSK